MAIYTTVKCTYCNYERDYDQHTEIEAVRRRKDEQIDKLVEQNGEALKIIHDLIKR